MAKSNKEQLRDVGYEMTDAWHGTVVDGETGFNIERLVPHHNADGTLKHYCTASHCPDIHGLKS